MTAAAAAVEIHDLSFAYPGVERPVLDGLSLRVAPGERVAILGPNGSGKTTLALHLNGLLGAPEAPIRIGGTPLGPDTLGEIRRRVGLVFQDPDDQLFTHTVRDDVAFGPANLGASPDEVDRRVDAALHAVDAAHLADRVPHHLSGGEKRRAALATVLSMDPDVLVLDEPTSGLDPAGGHELAALLTSLPQTQLIVTHDLPFALATCTRAVVLDHGKVQVDTDPDLLLGDETLLARHRLALPYGYHRVASPAPVRTPGFRMGHLDHVHIRVPDRAEAADWYRRHLGFEPVERYDFWASGIDGGPLQISADGGETTLALFETGPGHPMVPQRTGVAFRVDAASFAAFVRSLPGEVLTPDGDVLTSDHVVDFDLCWAIDLADPWGNQYELNCEDHETVRRELIEADGIAPRRYWPRTDFDAYRRRR